MDNTYKALILFSFMLMNTILVAAFGEYQDIYVFGIFFPLQMLLAFCFVDFVALEPEEKVRVEFSEEETIQNDLLDFDRRLGEHMAQAEAWHNVTTHSVKKVLAVPNR